MSAGQGATSSNPRRVSVRVRGRVQGVAYRASTRAEARRLGLVGWVRNLPDGGVELEAQGAADLVEALLAWCRIGPPAAVVTALDVQDLTVEPGATGFDVRY